MGAWQVGCWSCPEGVGLRLETALGYQKEVCRAVQGGKEGGPLTTRG